MTPEQYLSESNWISGIFKNKQFWISPDVSKEKRITQLTTTTSDVTKFGLPMKEALKIQIQKDIEKMQFIFDYIKESL